MMEYNTTRPKMIISEYGRNIQKMIEFTISIEDKEKRNKAAKAIIAVMGQLNPHLRDVGDFRHKLWDHLFIMSDFKLDVDSPYPIPSAETLEKKPEKINYPNKKMLFRYYGKNIELIVNKAMTLEEGPSKEALIKAIANHLKKSYLTWNKESVNDDVIAEHLSLLSGGKLILKEDIRLSSTSDILARNKTIKHTNVVNGNNSTNQKRTNFSKNRNNGSGHGNPNNKFNKPKP